MKKWSYGEYKSYLKSAKKWIFFLQDEHMLLAASQWVHTMADSYKLWQMDTPQLWRVQDLERLLQHTPIPLSLFWNKHFSN